MNKVFLSFILGMFVSCAYAQEGDPVPLIASEDPTPPAYFEDSAPVTISPDPTPDRVVLNIDGDTGVVCHSLISQVNLSAKEANFLENAQKLSRAKADLEESFNRSNKLKKAMQ